MRWKRGCPAGGVNLFTLQMSILRLMGNNSVEFIEDFARRWSRTVVPFFAQTNEFNPVVQGFGSGFLLRAKNEHWLVTALHVVRDAARHGQFVIVVDGKGIVLSKVPFVFDEINDLAVAPMDQLLREHEFVSVAAIDISPPPDQSSPLGFTVLLGYPASKNQFHLRFGAVDRYLLSLTVERAVPDASVETTLADPVLFGYHSSGLLDSQFKRTGQAPGLHGMSGGPALELRATRVSVEEYRFSSRLSGVLVEWHRTRRIVVAASVECLRALLNKAAAVAARGQPSAAQHRSG
jgi:hypothetical protein